MCSFVYHKYLLNIMWSSFDKVLSSLTLSNYIVTCKWFRPEWMLVVVHLPPDSHNVYQPVCSCVQRCDLCYNVFTYQLVHCVSIFTSFQEICQGSQCFKLVAYKPWVNEAVVIKLISSHALLFVEYFTGSFLKQQDFYYLLLPLISSLLFSVP